MGELKITGIKSLSDFCKVLYFTDAHNQPTLSQDRFVWLARLINQEKPDYVVDGGDFDDFHSLCSHERDETLKGRLKPSLLRDIECSAQARATIADELTHNPIRHVTLGNHEARLWKYEDENPAVYGIATGHYTDVLQAHGWAFSMYGEYHTIEGVDFTHIPFTGMGKPVGGDNSTRQIAEKSVRDVCFGHTHALQQATAHKFGPSRSVTALNGGCYMPQGYVAPYAQNIRKESWYGAHILMIRDGRIRSIRSYSLPEIEHLFRERPARVSVRVKQEIP